VATFVLVHGAWHGAWCWEPLAGELGSRGFGSLAMDLPCDDPDATLGDYADAVEASMGDADDPVLVGHSLGSVTIAAVAARRPVSRLIYLCGVIPSTVSTHGASDEPSDSTDIFRVLLRDTEGCSAWPPDGTGELYAGLDNETISWAVPQLRKQCGGIWKGFEPFERLDVYPSSTLICVRDTALPNEWSRWAAQRRLGGLEPIELDSGHFPMMEDPVGLADVLVSLV
jgi:pimeloyl-ACP methyl ester carboxylesterase